MPPHDTYVETHLGSGAVLLAKPPALRSIGIDCSAGVIARARRRRMPCQLIQGTAESALAGFDYGVLGRTLIYSDPPYLQGPGEVRSARRLYEHEYSRQDHIRLLEQLRAAPAAVMVSGYPSRLYDELIGDWRSIAFQTMTRGGVRTEKLWLNFPAGAVQWATFAGRNFTERQHIKRQAARWASRFKAMQPGRRLAVLAALLDAVDHS